MTRTKLSRKLMISRTNPPWLQALSPLVCGRQQSNGLKKTAVPIQESLHVLLAGDDVNVSDGPPLALQGHAASACRSQKTRPHELTTASADQQIHRRTFGRGERLEEPLVVALAHGGRIETDTMASEPLLTQVPQLG